MITHFDTCEFLCAILNQNRDLFKESFDVDSFFSNISLDETINTVGKLLCKNETIYNLNNDQFKTLSTLATREPYVHGVAMASLRTDTTYYLPLSLKEDLTTELFIRMQAMLLPM